MVLKNEIPRVVGAAERDESGISTVLSEVYHAIREVGYGWVQIHIQDGKVVQIDKLTKSRIR